MSIIDEYIDQLERVREEAENPVADENDITQAARQGGTVVMNLASELGCDDEILDNTDISVIESVGRATFDWLDNPKPGDVRMIEELPRYIGAILQKARQQLNAFN